MWRDLTPYVILGLLFAGFNYLSLPVIAAVGPGQGIFWGGTVAGVIGAQIGLVATWGVFSSASFMQRLGVCAAVGLALFGSFTLGILTVNYMVEGNLPGAVLLIALMVCPLAFFSVQLPLWATRTWLRCEVAKSSQPPRGSYLSPMRIKDLILGTTVASVALSIARMGPSLLPEGTPANSVLGVAFVACLIAFAASFTALLPLVCLTLGARHIAIGAIGYLVWFVLFVSILFVTVASVEGSASRNTLEACLWPTVSYAVVMCGGLLLVRRDGHSLLRRGREQPVPGESDQADLA